MKNNRNLVSLLTLALVLMGGMFYASCSSEDDPMTFEESGNEKAEYIKNKVLMLAEEYGLDFKIENEALFMKEAAEGKINVDSMETHFKALSQIKGYYTGLMASGNKITVDTGKEKLLKKVSRTERKTDDHKGGFTDMATNGYGATLYYTVYCTYNAEAQTGTVEFDNFYIMVSGFTRDLDYNTQQPYISNLKCSYDGELQTLTYSASVKFYTDDGKWSISFSLSGKYIVGTEISSAGAGASPTMAANNTTNGGFGYAVIQ